MAALADQIHHCPVALPHLHFTQFQTDQLRPAEATTKQHGQHGVVALRSHANSTRTLEYF